jgi:hypothetical protein
MTEIEALLKVDAGQLPPATVAFFAVEENDDADQRAYAALAAMTAIAAVACGLCGGGNLLIALLVLIAATFTVVATPTIRDPDPDAPRPCKRRVMVVTSQGLIVRDAWGLRSWRFDDLSDVVSSSHEHRPYIILVQRDGTRHALDYMSFQRGEQLREVIGSRLKLQTS